MTSSGSARRRYIDWARGLAVLVMIEAHTIDAWTRGGDRLSIGFRNARILGGFAAPLFLWLAGVALAMSAASFARRGGSRGAAVAAVCRRGLEIFALAFLFRIQAFVVSPGGDWTRLLRVDILNVMGPAMIAAGVVWGLSENVVVQCAIFSAVTIAVAMFTPVVRASHAIDVLPAWIQWYVRPAGEHTTFVLFPWAGFVFAGAAAGVLIARATTVVLERRLHVWLASVGVVAIACGAFTATLPPLYAASWFWTTSPTYFAIRVGILMLLLAAMFAIAQRSPAFSARCLEPLERLGRSSLFVYWIHVELVYGYASWLWRGRLPLWAALTGWVLFSAAMYGVLVLKDRYIQSRPSGRAARPIATATA